MQLSNQDQTNYQSPFFELCSGYDDFTPWNHVKQWYYTTDTRRVLLMSRSW